MVSQYVVENNTYRFLYRSDSRPPSIILRKGFEGSPIAWPFNVFGKKTVSTINKQEYAGIFSRCFSKSTIPEGQNHYYSDKGIFYIYRIHAIGLKIFPISELANTCNHSCLIKNIKETILKIYPVFIMYPFAFDKALCQYVQKLKDNQQYWKETAVEGPVEPERIEFKEMAYPCDIKTGGLHILFEKFLKESYLSENK